MMTLKDYAAALLTKEWQRRMKHQISAGKREGGRLSRGLPFISNGYGSKS